MKNNFLFVFLLLISTKIDAQKRGVGIGTAVIDESAILHVASSNYDKTGSGATATATVNSSGVVTAVTVTNGGSGYVAPVTVDIYGTGDTFGIASGARGTATISNGVITGITVTKGGSGYVSGSTNVSINPGNKAMVFPRIDLVSLTNGTTPINNPADGLFIYNNPTNITSGIHFWNSTTSSFWERGIPQIETPKTAMIEFSGSDTYILDNANAGSYVALSDPGNDSYVYNLGARDLGLKTVTVDANGLIRNYIQLPAGRYKIEVTMYLYAPPANPTTRATEINGNSGYFYMGYFIDCRLAEYNIATSTYLSTQPTVSAPYSAFGNSRKEYGVISKTDQYHRMTQIFNLNVSPPVYSGDATGIWLNIGRMSGSGFADQFFFSRSKSYIKVSRF